MNVVTVAICGWWSWRLQVRGVLVLIPLRAVKELQAHDSDGSDDQPDADEEFKKMYPKKADPRDYLSKRTAEEVFKQFDVDGSGLLDLDEFIEMLPALGIYVRCVGVHPLRMSVERDVRPGGGVATAAKRKP